MNLTIYTDGASRGNPGPAGIGVAVLNENGELIEEFCRYIGETTNNTAEYEALLAGLDLSRKYSPSSLCFFMDSELLVKQLNGSYRVKNENLIGLHAKAVGLAKSFPKVSFTHIPREKNKAADRLANKAIDHKVL